MGINLSKVNFAYGYPKKKLPPKYVLKDINIEISDANEFIMLLGASGSGKSTLVQLFNGLLLSNEGDVLVFGKRLCKQKSINLKDVRKKVGLVFQFPEYQLFEETVLKDVEFGPKNFGLENYQELAKEALRVVGIDETLYYRSPYALSGGQMRKVAIAGILASNPDILVFDEPTVGLDPVAKKELVDLLKELNDKYNKTIILITHDMEVVGEAGKRIVVLKDGNIVFDGEKDSLFMSEDIIEKYSLDYPPTVKTLREIKKKFNVKLNELQYTVEDAYQELERVFDHE